MKLILSIVGALILEILPLPVGAMYLRPEFLLILMMYWVLTMPYPVGLGRVWLLGLVADLLHNDLLGERALLMAIVIFIVIKFHSRIRLFPLPQQMLTVFLLVFLFQCLRCLVLCSIGHAFPPFLYWVASLTSVLCWPLMPYVLKSQQQFNRSLI